MSGPFAASVVRVRAAGGAVKGAGFVTPDRRVMTCAHVVNQALGRDLLDAARPDAPLDLDLPFDKGTALRGRVVEWHPPLDAEARLRQPVADIAVIEATEVPARIRAEPVPNLPPAVGQQLRSYGFPDGHDTGTFATAEVLSEAASGWLVVRDPAIGQSIAPGFSGAPAFDATSNDILGMVVAAELDPAQRTGYLIPGHILH